MEADDGQKEQAFEPAAFDAKPGARATFPYDRIMVERFREAFPRARWRDDLNAWFVPGTTAGKRIDRWLARELSGSFTYADQRGRDAFEFDPIESAYLKADEDLRVITPYSRTIVSALREVPWSHWDPDAKAWRIPYRSLEDLRKHWPVIEAAARRNEPAERLRRRQAADEAASHEQAKARNRERQRRRYPVSSEAIPPPGKALMTTAYGIVIFTEITGELVDKTIRDEHYSGVSNAQEDLVWAEWRTPTLAELVETWPAKRGPVESETVRGWWQPTLQELRHARRRARSIERAQETRRSKQRSPR